ncbi:unnamed protein product, partial [Didymodactylos carnosus]
KDNLDGFTFFYDGSMYNYIRTIQISFTPIRDVKFLNESDSFVMTVSGMAKRFSADLACADIDNSHPQHIYFQPTPDHVLSVDYSDWLDSAVLCGSNGHVCFYRLTNFVRWTRKNECSTKYRVQILNIPSFLQKSSTDNQQSISSNSKSSPSKQVNQKGSLTSGKNESINNGCDDTYEKGAYSELIKNIL